MFLDTRLEHWELAPGHTEAASSHLVAHYLGAAVVDSGLEGAHQVVGEHAVFDGVFRAVKQLGVGPQNLGDGLRGSDPMLGGPHFLGRAFVGEVAALFHQRHTAHGHQSADLRFNP